MLHCVVRFLALRMLHCGKYSGMDEDGTLYGKYSGMDEDATL